MIVFSNFVFFLNMGQSLASVILAMGCCEKWIMFNIPLQQLASGNNCVKVSCKS